MLHERSSAPPDTGAYTLFGPVDVPNPQWNRCICRTHAPKTFRPTKASLLGRTCAELLYLEPNRLRELGGSRDSIHLASGGRRLQKETSARPVPLDSYLAEDLLRWRRISPYAMPTDWIFASPTMRGKQPYWPDNLMKRYIRPVARAAGIHKRIGWHTFRHTFGTLLKANGEDVKTVQELLRHANSRIMLEVYMQAVTWQMRAAQSKVVRMMVTGMGERAKSA